MGAWVAILVAVAGVLGFGLRASIATRQLSLDGGLQLGSAGTEAAMVKPVREYFALRLSGTYGSAERELDSYRKALRHLTGEARRALRETLRKAQSRATGREVVAPPNLAGALSHDRLVWTNAVELPRGSETSTGGLELEVKKPDLREFLHVSPKLGEVEVQPKGDEPVIIRRASSGCFVLDGDFKVVWEEGRWQIGGLPAETPCTRHEDPDALERSWAYVPPPAGRAIGIAGFDDETLPRWARGRLQRIEPVAVKPDPFGATPSDVLFDREEIRSRPETITAWRSKRSTAVGTRLTFVFPRAVQLARVRLHNGRGIVTPQDRTMFESNGRIAVATLGSDKAEFGLLVPDRPEQYAVHCGFGATAAVTLTIRSVYPAGTKARQFDPDDMAVDALRPTHTHDQSNVALSDISFWGVPAPPPGAAAPAPPSPDRVARRPRYLRDDSYAASCETPRPGPTYPWRLQDGTTISVSLTEKAWGKLRSLFPPPAAPPSDAPPVEASPPVRTGA